MKKIMNIKTFAELAGVSTATVSRVFAHDPKVRPQTAEQVRALAKKYGFRPNLIAQTPFNGKTRSIGVLLWRLSNSFCLFTRICGRTPVLGVRQAGDISTLLQF